LEDIIKIESSPKTSKQEKIEKLPETCIRSESKGLPKQPYASVLAAERMQRCSNRKTGIYPKKTDLSIAQDKFSELQPQTPSNLRKSLGDKPISTVLQPSNLRKSLGDKPISTVLQPDIKMSASNITERKRNFAATTIESQQSLLEKQMIPLKIKTAPGESLSLPNLARAKDELTPYLDPSAQKTIFFPKTKEFINNIINQESVSSLELMLICIQTLKNSQKKVLKKLFDVQDPENAGGRGIFLRWLDCAFRVMASKRNTPEGIMKMKETKSLQTEECVAIEIMNFIVQFKVINKVKQLHVMKDIFKVDWFVCVKMANHFAKQHAITSLLNSSIEAERHLNKIKRGQEWNQANLDDADCAAGGMSTGKKNKYKRAKNNSKHQPSLNVKDPTARNAHC